MRDDRVVVANHEAGHAVTAWACGIDTEFVNIIKTVDRKGGVLLRQTDQQHALFNGNDVDFLRRRIMVCSAGLAADYRHAAQLGLREEILEGYNSDRRKAEEFMVRIGEIPGSRFLQYACLVQGFFGFSGWNIVEQVAEILVARDELSTDEIASLRAACPQIPQGTTALADNFTAN